MISSCGFTFGESSVWDPKLVREYLDIPECQLDILRNLPEWSKSRHNDKASRIEKDTCENSQPSQLVSNVTLERNEKLITQNIALFDETFETRKSILQAYKLKSSKLIRSYSLFEIDRISNSSFYNNCLRSTLSLPNIYLPENFHTNIIASEIKNSDSSENHLSLSNIDLPVYKESGKACITEQTNKDTIELEKNKDQICSKRSDMEEDAQLSISKPCMDEVKNNEASLEILVENKTISTNHTFQPFNHTSNFPDKFTASNNQSTLLTSPNKFTNSISSKNIKATTLIVSDNINLFEKDVDVDKENMPSKSSTLEESGTGSKEIKSGSPNPSEKNEPVLNIIEETVHADTTKEKKEVEANINSQITAKVNETYNQVSESYGISKDLSTKASLVLPNEPAIKVSCDSGLSKLAVENDQQMINKDVNDKSLFAETLSVKRKLESKNRSLKKRRKQSYHEEKSIKKAGDICYSAEHIQTMLDIMKHFI